MPDEPARPRVLPLDPREDAGPPGLDEMLVEAGRGDEAAFAQVYQRLAPSVFGLAKRVVRDPALAEDVSQEVFASVWRLATRYDPGKGSAQTWVLTLTHRRAVDLVRSDEAASRRESHTAAYDTPFDTVHEQAATRIEREQVRRCLSALTDVQREVVMLAYYGGHTYAEVSALLQANLSTVKTRMRDGLVRLRDCLGGNR
jgi:RNA polymerase sigma-70 factor (ECF subfamily)